MMWFGTCVLLVLSITSRYNSVPQSLADRRHPHNSGHTEMYTAEFSSFGDLY